MSERLDKVKAIAELIRLDRPVGSILLLAPVLWALWLANSGQPNPAHAVIFIVGVFVMRSVGCAINDWFDRDIDPNVERTKERPLARGALMQSDVFMVIGFGVFVALLLVLQLPTKVLFWSAPALILTLSYPLFKRFTHLPQVVLGIAFTWSIPMVYSAAGRSVGVEAWLLLFANFCWVLYYDTAYAMSDREDDLRVGVKSTAILLGNNDVRALVLLQCLTLSSLVVIGLIAGLSLWYFLILVIAAGFFVYQFSLFYRRERWKCFRAFVNNGWFGMTVFFAFLLGL